MEFELSVLVLALKVKSCPNTALGIESLPTPSDRFTANKHQNRKMHVSLQPGVLRDSGSRKASKTPRTTANQFKHPSLSIV